MMGAARHGSALAVWRWSWWLVPVLTVELVLAAPSIVSAGTTLAGSSTGWLGAAAAAVASMIAFAAVRSRTLRAGGVTVPLRRSVPVSYAAGALHTSLPGRAVISTAYAFRHLRSWGASNVVSTSETTVDGPSHVLVTETNNGTEPAQLSATKGDDVSATDSVDISATVGGSIAGIVDASVTGSYGHTWSTGHSFTTGVVNTVPAGYYGEITAIAPMIRDTGDFTITMGNTTWNLDGVYFDTPNPDGAEHFGYDQHPLTQAQKDTLPKTAVVTTR